MGCTATLMSARIGPTGNPTIDYPDGLSWPNKNSLTAQLIGQLLALSRMESGTRVPCAFIKAQSKLQMRSMADWWSRFDYP
jgi:hypothetical protein